MEEEKKKNKMEKKEEKKIKRKEKKEKKKEKKLERKQNKTKKRIKLKKKWLPLLLLPIIVIGILSFFLIKNYKENTLKQLKKNYNQYVITTSKAKLYDENHKEVGTLPKKYYLELEEIKNLSYKNRYLKIKDSTYYVSYKDIKKTKQQEQIKVESNYLPMNKNIETKKEVKLLQNNKVIITLKKGINAPIEYIDDNYYYVTYFNQNYAVKKEKDIKEIKHQNNDEKEAEYVSVIYYEKIDDNCNDDVCLKKESVKAHIDKLQKEGYYFLTKEEYLNYIRDYARLKENAIFLTTNESNDYITQIKNEVNVEIAKIEEQDKIQMETTNKKSTKEDDKSHINRYQAKRYTLIDTYSSMARGEDVVDNGKENSNDQRIAVVNYHFFYDASIGESCNESICLEKEKFRSHLEWIKNNNYKALTIKEFADWKDGLIEIPDHSLLITIDDGAMGTSTINGNVLMPLLEEYQIHATLFLITGWWDIENYRSPYLDVQSHTHWLHEEASCSDGRGTFVCSDYETDKSNLQESLNVLKDNTSFCFPFYSYDRESLQAIQDLGFRVAFIGGNTKARRSNDNLLIPRYPILDDISLQGFINMVS